MVKYGKYSPVKFANFVYIYVLSTEKVTIFAAISAEKKLFPCITQIYTKSANFTAIYFPYFTTLLRQTLQFY